MAFSVDYTAGGSLDEIKKINNIKNITQVDKVVGLPIYRRPYNTMMKLDIPAIKRDYESIYTVETDCEMIAISLNCSGYGESDNYDIYADDKILFKKWYCAEVQEGLYLGTTISSYHLNKDAKLKLVFHNESSTAKTVWLGIRMLVDENANL